MSKEKKVELIDSYKDFRLQILSQITVLIDKWNNTDLYTQRWEKKTKRNSAFEKCYD